MHPDLKASTSLGIGPIHRMDHPVHHSRNRGKNKTKPHSWGTRQRRAAKLRRRMA